MKYLCPLLVLFFLGFTADAQELQNLNVVGGQITFLSEGQGEPVVFVHGAQEDFRIFLPQFQLFSDQYQAVAYSRRYNFPNDNPVSTNYTAISQAEDLKILVDKIGKPIHLVGHSYGGLISMQFAMKYPSLIKTLTLSEPALLDWLKQIPACPMSYEDVKRSFIDETKAAFQTGDTTLVMKELFEFFAGADLQDQIPEEVLTMLKQNLREMEAIVNSEGSFDAPSPEELASLKMPIMLLTGTKTMSWMHCMNDKLVASLPKATHHHLEAGHEMWVTHPEELSKILLDFLEASADE